MAKAESNNTNGSSFEFRRINIPSNREYDDPADADLDNKLVIAIQAARKAGEDQLASELELQLGSHYYGSELGL
jgi:hypothetical protein